MSLTVGGKVRFAKWLDTPSRSPLPATAGEGLALLKDVYSSPTLNPSGRSRSMSGKRARRGKGKAR